MTAEVNNSDLYALHSKISDHVKNKTPLYLIDPEVDLLDSALTVRYNLIDIFNRLRCSVPEMPGEGATDDEQKEIDKIRIILEEYRKYTHVIRKLLQLTGKQVDVCLKAISTTASKRNFIGGSSDEKEKNI
jgi:hypothetical protein